MSLNVSSAVRGVIEQNSVVNKWLCEDDWTGERAIIAVMCIFPFYYFITGNLQLPMPHFIPNMSQINSLNSTKFQNRKTRWLTMSALLIFGKRWNFLYPIQCAVPSRKTRIRKKLGLIHISEFRLYKDRLVCILFYIFTFCSLTSSIPLRLFIGYEIRTENLSVFFPC